MLVNIVKADIETFRLHQGRVLDIYMETATSGVMQQTLSRDTELKYMLGLFEADGHGYLAFDGGNLIGFMLSGALGHDDLLPGTVRERFPVDRCYYISEMHVAKEYQGKGIGSQMMQKCLDEIDRHRWDYLFIRAWKENEGALKLYQRFGFKLDEIIEQEKIKKDRSSTFIIQKQYLWKKL
ncbi:MAG TPA: GNAT family N-acetyltransferase [Candidatus Nanoarchaeia archaeon]|nr:GNAT family N-acetyltransferase [Candidatus Nanoarchaeia archaeon]